MTGHSKAAGPPDVGGVGAGNIEGRTVGGRSRRFAYLPGLDGLRAIAVAGVLLYHADLGWLAGGYLGVDVFFVLSGFLITSLLLGEWQRSGRIDLKAFWIRRARRLLPALFVLLAASLAFAVIFLQDEVANLRNDAIAALAYATNWYLIFSRNSYFETVGRPSLFQHLWSLAVEEQFYLLWPLILTVLLRFLRRWALLLLLAGAAASTTIMWLTYNADTDPSRLYYGTDTRAASLLIGSALAFLLANLTRAAARRRAFGRLLDLTGAVALGALIWFFVQLDETQGVVYQGGLLVIELTTAVLILALVYPDARIMPRLLGGRIMQWVGRRSYGIYLWHWPVLVVTRPQLDVPLDGVPLLILRLGVTLLLAELSFKCVEAPVRGGSLARAWRDWRSAGQNRAGSEWLRWSGSVSILLGIAILVGVPVVEARPPAAPDYLPVQNVNTIDPSSTAPPANGDTGRPLTADPEPTASGAPPTEPRLETTRGDYYSLPPAPPAKDTAPPSAATAGAARTAQSAPVPPPGTQTLTVPPAPSPPAANVPLAGARPPHIALIKPSTRVPRPFTPTKTATPPTVATYTPAPATVNVPPPDQAVLPIGHVTTDAVATVPPAQLTPVQPAEIASLGRITAIGDSVMLGAAPNLKQLGNVYIDAAVGRQLPAAISLLNTYHAGGRLGSIVVVHMGNNGTFSAKQLDQVMSVLSDEKYVVLVNLKVPRSWESPNNEVIMEGVARYRNAVMVDWHGASLGHPEYFARDGFHMQKLGAQVYTNLIGSMLKRLVNR